MANDEWKRAMSKSNGTADKLSPHGRRRQDSAVKPSQGKSPSVAAKKFLFCIIPSIRHSSFEIENLPKPLHDMPPAPWRSRIRRRSGIL